MPRKATTRAAQGGGSIRQRPDGRWEARYVAGRSPDGQPIRRSIYANTQAEVSKRLREVLSTIDRGEYITPDSTSVHTWLAEWLRVYVMPTKRPNTVSCYRNCIEKHIVPRIGALKLQKLRVENVQAMFNDLVRAGFAPSTVIKTRNVLHAALEQAVTNQLLTRNVVEGATVPRLEQKEIFPLPIDEQKRFVEALPDTPTGRALAFILRTGLRVGELIGLAWGDVDKDSLTVRRTMRRTPIIYDDGGNIDASGNKRPSTSIQTGKPKTGKGKRQIPLGEKARSILDAQRRYQLSERIAAGSAWTDNGLIFSTRTGQPLEVRNVSRVLYGVLESIGAEKRGVHALRHTFATRWIESGGDVKALSEVLGHADVATTLRLYVHASSDVKRRGMATLDSLV